jgi:hypothetical protein
MFYRPHFACGSSFIHPSGDPAHVGQWLAEVMTGTKDGAGKLLTPPDFIGLSEAENMKMFPGGSLTGFKNYKAIGSVCKAKHIDPTGMFYDSAKWDLLESFPADKQCQQYPPLDGSNGFDCAKGQASPGKDAKTACCTCTHDPGFEKHGEDAIYDLGSWNPKTNSFNTSSYNSYRGTRTFVAGQFKSKKSGRQVCAVVFNLPHPLLDKCTSSPTSPCFSNEAMNAFRIGTGQLVNTIQTLCKGMPIIFTGDTNINSGTYETSYLFYNPNYETKDSKICPQASPLLVLKDPQSPHTPFNEQPYTCCVDKDPKTKEWTANGFASDRVSASGMSFGSGGNYFKPKELRGGASKPGEGVKDPDSYGKGSTCPNASPDFVGLPCCGCAEEHAPVWGVFDLMR